MSFTEYWPPTGGVGPPWPARSPVAKAESTLRSSFSERRSAPTTRPRPFCADGSFTPYWPRSTDTLPPITVCEVKPFWNPGVLR